MIHPRPAIALLAVVVMGFGTFHSTWGFYTPGAFAAVMGSLVLGVLACAAPARPIRVWSRIERHDLLPGLFVCAIILLGTAGSYPNLLYAEPDFDTIRITKWYSRGLLVVMPIAVLNGVIDGLKFRPAFRRAVFIAGFAAIVVAALAVRWLVLVGSPEPVIDVYNLLRDGADYVIAGQNPYANDIVSPYGTPRAERFGVGEPADPRPAGYPPLPFLFSVPPRLLGADVRWANTGADLVAAGAIALVGWRRRRPAVALTAAWLYLNQPRAPFIIEQAWYEPMIAALLGLGLVFTEFRGLWKWAGYALVGLGLTAKQFGLPLLLPMAAGHRRNWKLVALGVFAGVLVMLPWVVWSPSDFFDIVLWKHLDRPPQPHSITIASFLLNEFDVTVPRAAGWALAAGAIVLISIVTPRGSAATALGLGTALLAFSVFHTQGFPNYFYLVVYLWLLGVVAALPIVPEVPTDEPAHRTA
jgi:hypothetical protein